ncbi:MAG: EAL domain-containing protein [Pseudomonadota bacterium]
MPAASPPSDETTRLRALKALTALDSQPEQAFDRIVTLAADLAGVPISLISLVDEHRQWFKANTGLGGVAETHRDHAFCAHAILDQAVTVVPDATLDSRFSDNPLVLGEPGIRFYAGAPLRLKDGHQVGTLCVIDRKPRQIDERTVQQLSALSSIAASLLELRRSRTLLLEEQGRLVAENRARRVAEAALEGERSTLANVIDATDVGTWEWDVSTGHMQINERFATLLGYSPKELSPFSIRHLFSMTHPDDCGPLKAMLAGHLGGRMAGVECEIRLRNADGLWVWVQSRGSVLARPSKGDPQRMFGVILSIQERKEQEQELARSKDLLEAMGRIAGVGGWEVDLQQGEIYWTEETRRIHGVDSQYVPDLDAAVGFYAEDGRREIQRALDEALRTGSGWDLELPFVRASGEAIWVRAQGQAEQADGCPTRLFGAFQDITERRHLVDELQRQGEELRVTLESIGDAVVTTDPAGCVQYVNPVANAILNHRGELVGARFADMASFVDEASGELLPNPIGEAISRRETVQLARTALLRTAGGREIAVEGCVSPLIDAQGTLLGAVLVLRDVGENRRLLSEMSYQAKHDGLTGLVNRAEFERCLGGALESSRSIGVHHALLMIDLDQFKIVNDTCGHAAGDALLREVCDLIRSGVRSNDTVARLGGDEFAVLLMACQEDAALQIAEGICQRVSAYRFVHSGSRFRVGASIGLVVLDSRWGSVDRLLQAADNACYAAKERGRDRVHRYQEEDDAILSRQSSTRWVVRLEEALERDWFALDAQMIYRDGGGDSPVGAELFLRMCPPNQEPIMPGAFLPAAERFNLAPRVDQWVVVQALRSLVQGGVRIPTYFINLSAQSICDDAFHRFLLDSLQQLEATERERIVLEVTETAVISNMGAARKLLAQLRSHGVKVALDDFGSGMASFAYLRELAVDYLKIDGQFVTSLQDDPLSVVAVRAFVDAAQTLGIPVIAEHVHSATALAALRELGVPLFQGFHLHRPVPLDSLIAEASQPVAG